VIVGIASEYVQLRRPGYSCDHHHAKALVSKRLSRSGLAAFQLVDVLVQEKYPTSAVHSSPYQMDRLGAW